MTSAFPVAFGATPDMRAAALPHGGIVAIVRQSIVAWCANRGVTLTPAGPLAPRALTAETLRVPLPLSWHGPLARLAKVHDTSISGVVRLSLGEMLGVRARVSKARGDLREQSPERRAQAELEHMKREERAQQRREAAEIAASRVCPVCGAEPVARRRRMDEFDARCANGHRWWQAVPGVKAPPPRDCDLEDDEDEDAA